MNSATADIVNNEAPELVDWQVDEPAVHSDFGEMSDKSISGELIAHCNDRD